MTPVRASGRPQTAALGDLPVGLRGLLGFSCRWRLDSPTSNMESNPDIIMTSIPNGHRLSLLLKNRSNYQFHTLDKPEVDWLIQVTPGVFAQALNVTRVDLIKAIWNRETQIRSE